MVAITTKLPQLWIRNQQNEIVTCEFSILLHFFAVFCEITTWNDQIWSTVEDVLMFAKNLKFRTKNFGEYGLSLFDREILKWLSKLMTQLPLPLRLLRSAALRPRQSFNQWEAKPIASCTRDFSRAMSKLRVIGRNSDWFIALFPPVVIGRWNYFGKSLDSRSIWTRTSTTNEAG